MTKKRMISSNIPMKMNKTFIKINNNNNKFN